MSDKNTIQVYTDGTLSKHFNVPTESVIRTPLEFLDLVLEVLAYKRYKFTTVSRSNFVLVGVQYQRVGTATN